MKKIISKLEGSKQLLKLKEREMELLMMNLTYSEIGDKFNISTSQARVLCIQKSKDFPRLRKEIKNFLELEINEPFSKNENDYGGVNHKNMITKEGLLDSIGNAPIVRKQSELSKAIEIYKNSL